MSAGSRGRGDPQIVRRPLVLAALAFSIGVLVDSRDNLAGNLAMALSLAGLAAVLAARRRIASVFLLPLAFLAAGLAVGELRLPPQETVTAALGPVEGRRVVFEGVVMEAPEVFVDRTRVVLDLTGTSSVVAQPLVPASGRVLLTISGPVPCGEPGDRIRALARVGHLGPSRFPGEVSARARAARRGVSFRAYVSSARECVRLSSREKSELGVAIERARASMNAAISRALSDERAALVRALATGDRSGLDSAARERYARAGLSHLLAVSGLHLSVVSGIFIVLLGFALRRLERVSLGIGARRLAALVALPIVVLYTLMVGASPSAVRAAIMVSSLLVAHVLLRSPEPWSALALALVLMLAVDPASLGDVSFQLSFAAVAALYRIFPPIRRVISLRLPRLMRPVSDLALASLAVTIGTAPLILRHFGRVSIVGLLANVPATPIASAIAVPLSLLGSLLSLASEALAGPFLWLAGLSTSWIDAIARAAAVVPSGAPSLPSPSILECLLFYGGTIGLTAQPPRPWLRKVGLSCLALLAAIVLALEVRPKLSRDLRVSFLPVGHGDAALVELPGGRTMLVDTGQEGERSVATSRVVLPYLRHRRIRRLDYVVISHPHADHAGGLARLMEDVEVGEVWWNGDRRESDPRILEALSSLDRAPVIVDASRPPLEIRGARVEVLAPKTAVSGEMSVNDASVVISVGLGSHEILFAGDIEAEAEAEMVERVGDRLRADVLKVPHHGSRTSSTEAFIDAVRPSHALMSAGGRFGFPHEEVEDRYRARGSAVWRTDLHGAVVVTTDGESLTVTPFLASAAPAP